MSKLPDINYALMTQLSYFNWSKLKDSIQMKKIFF